MNIAKDFADYLVSLSKGTFNTDIFIGPLPYDAPEKCYWIVNAGGSPQPKIVTGERIKEYQLNVFYRNTDGEDVYNEAQNLEETINSSEITTLGDRALMDISAMNFPADRDLDNQERIINLTQVTIQVYTETS